MGVHMALEVALFREGHIAVGTAKRILPGVGAHVPNEVRVLPKGCVAEVAGKGTLPGVAAHVDHEFGPLVKRGRTQVTLEGALARVNAEVYSHVIPVLGHIVTLQAGLQSALCAHEQTVRILGRQSGAIFITSWHDGESHDI